MRRQTGVGKNKIKWEGHSWSKISDLQDVETWYLDWETNQSVDES